MKSHETLHETLEKELVALTKDHSQPAHPRPSGGQWQFKVLLFVIALCVLMLVGKVFGLF